VIAIGRDKSISKKVKPIKDHSLKSNVSDERPTKFKSSRSKENVVPGQNGTLDNKMVNQNMDDRVIEVFRSADQLTNSANISFTRCNEQSGHSSPKLHNPIYSISVVPMSSGQISSR
jgi:hypothetical protein